MTPEQLKASLLQYAMKGRITEQLESDGNASELLPLLNIDPKVKANDPPFDIPENWLWIPIGDLGESTGTDSFSDGPFGSNLKTVHYIKEPEVRIIQLSNIGENGWKDQNIKYTSYKHLEEVIPRCEVHPGDFVIAKMMPAGRTIEVPDLGTRMTLGSDAMKFVPNKNLDKKYLLWAMHSQAFLEQVYSEAHGITRVRTTLNGVKSYVLPIPPLKEQHRIVAKIEELLPYVDRYAEAYEKLEQFNAKFPEDMKKSILQYAIQGKLVEQRAEEGTAEELYKQIQDEKQKLIKEGKIKKEKPLAEITEDEIPFDIPDTWKWVKLSEVGELSRGRSKHRPRNDSCLYEGGGYPFIQTGDVAQTDFRISKWTTEYNSVGVAQSKLWPKGTLCLTIAANIGDVAILDFDACFPDSVVGFNAYKPICDNKFFLYGLICYKSILDKMSHSTAQRNINLDILSKVAFPLPPVKEQIRIVSKIEELLPYCDSLAG